MKLKLDADGKVVVENGMPVYVHDDGKEIPFDASAALSKITALTVGGNYTANMAFDRNAFLLASRTPAMPDGGDTADDVMNVTDPVSGITFQIALYRQYRQVRYEVGLAWGVASVKPEHSTIILG